MVNHAQARNLFSEILQRLQGAVFAAVVYANDFVVGAKLLQKAVGILNQLGDGALIVVRGNDKRN